MCAFHTQWGLKSAGQDSTRWFAEADEMQFCSKVYFSEGNRVDLISQPSEVT